MLHCALHCLLLHEFLSAIPCQLQARTVIYDACSRSRVEHIPHAFLVELDECAQSELAPRSTLCRSDVAASTLRSWASSSDRPCSITACLSANVPCSDGGGRFDDSRVAFALVWSDWSDLQIASNSQRQFQVANCSTHCAAAGLQTCCSRVCCNLEFKLPAAACKVSRLSRLSLTDTASCTCTESN
jgi:hypothetical protein